MSGLLARIGLVVTGSIWLVVGVIASAFVSAHQDENGEWMQGIDHVSPQEAAEFNAHADETSLVMSAIAALHLVAFVLSLVPRWTGRTLGLAGAAYAVFALALGPFALSDPQSALPVYLVVGAAQAAVCLRASFQVRRSTPRTS